MIRTISFDPFIPLPILISIFVLATILLVFFLFKAPRSIFFRILVTALLLAIISNPLIQSAEKIPLKDIAIILVDHSQSQELDERRAITNSATLNLRSKLESLENIEVRETIVGDESGSDLWASYSNSISSVPHSRLAGIFIITDGQATDEKIASAPMPIAPVHILLTGRKLEFDRKLSLVNAPRYGIIGEPVDVSFRIDDIGPNEVSLPENNSVTVILRVDGDEVYRENVPTGSVISFQAPMSKPGETIIELEASTLAGELSTINNVVVLPITAIRDRLRVLLISGEPHAGERAWRNLLKSDPAIDLVHFTILRPIEKAQSDGALERELALIEFPQDELFIEKLSEFDLLIFDRYTYRGVLNAFHFDNIGRYVEDGGAVLVSAGPEFDGYLSLAARRNFSFILPALPTGPAIEEPFRAQVSNDGNKHPATSSLTDREFWGRWLRIMPVTKRSGRTLMTGPDDSPLLILDRVGKGRVGLLLSDHVWLWARGFDGGGPHAELLRRISHWLMKEPDLEEEQLKLSENDGNLLIERRTIEEVVNDVDLIFPDGTSQTYSLNSTETEGLHSRLLASLPSGLYRARSGNLFAASAIGKKQETELQDVVMDETELKPLADQSLGEVFAIRNNQSVQIPDIRRVKRASKNHSITLNSMQLLERNAARTTTIQSEELFSPLIWLFLLTVGLLGTWLSESNKLKFNLSK